MEHKVGEYEVSSFIGHKMCYLTHSAKRFYYMYRNNIITFRKFFKYFPAYCIRMEIFQIKDFIKLLLFEKNRKTKLSMIKNGVVDGVKYKFNSNAI
jgi:hypothetical protein